MKVNEFITVVEDVVCIKTYMEDEDEPKLLQEFDLNDPMEFDKCSMLYGKNVIEYSFIEDCKLSIIIV